MSITTTQFIRKPLYVDAVRITGANFDEVAAWCQGEIKQDEVPGKGTTRKYIKIRVHNPKNARQTKAFVGDWLLYTERGYKVYTAKAFRASFDPTTYEQVSEEIQENKDTVVIGPECFAAEDGSVVSWRGVNYVPQEAVTPLNPDQLALEQQRPVAVTPQAETLEVHTDSEVPVAVVDTTEQPENVDTVPSNEPIDPAAAEGKKVLSIAEQNELTPDEVRAMVQSGEAVLAQDIAAA